MIGKSATEASISAVVTVAAGTRWERRFDYGVVAGEGVSHRRRVEREVAAYREQIAREGYRPREGGRVLDG